MTDDSNRDFSGAVNQSPGMNGREGVARTWDVAMSERVMQLEAAGAQNLSCAQVLGLIAFVRDGEGSTVPAASAPSAWQPIATAPLNQNVLIYCPEASPEYHVMICALLKFDGDPDAPEWCEVSDSAPAIDVEPSHWMPLPPLPSSDRGGVGVHRTTESEDAPIGHQKTRDAAP